MDLEFSNKSHSNAFAPRLIGRRKFIVAAGGTAALVLTPGGLGSKALADETIENVMLGDGEFLLDAATDRNQLWTLIQTPNGTALRTSAGNAPSFPSRFEAECLGKSGNQIVAGGHRIRPMFQRFEEGNYAALIAISGLPGLESQPRLDSWPTEGIYESETNELVPAYVVLSNVGWSAPIDVPNLGDIAGSVTSVIGSNGSLDMVVDSLLDSAVRDSTIEILQVKVSTRSGQTDRTHVVDTVHGTSTVLGQDDNKTYIMASSPEGKKIVEVSDGELQSVELQTELNPLSVSIENGDAELFVEGDNGELGSIPLEEVGRRDGDIEDHLQDEKLGKRSFGEDVVLAYEVEGAGS